MHVGDCVYHVYIFTGLEYKFMVKSVDPDGTTSVTEKKNKTDNVVQSLNRDLHEEGMEEDAEEVEEYGDKVGEMASPAPVILEEKEILPNRTGNDNYFNINTSNCLLLDCCPGPKAKHTDVWDNTIISAVPETYL